MKTLLYAGMMTLALVGNVQAGWFGLTEDYPLRNPSTDRTLFIVGGVRQCVADTRDANLIGLSRSQILYVCNCRAERVADSITKTELEYIRQYDKRSPKFEKAVAVIDGECFLQMMTEDRQRN